MKVQKDPFGDARLKLARAQEHTAELNTLIRNYFSSKPWTTFVQPKRNGPGYVHKARFGEGFDPRIKILAADTFADLRAALDMTAATCARLNGLAIRKIIHFPFLSDPLQWSTYTKSRCPRVPDPVIDYFLTLRPYPGGDGLLYGLNGARVDSEHWAFIETVIAIMGMQVIWPDWRSEMLQCPSFTVGDVDEVELFTTPDFTTNYKLDVILGIRFEGISAFGGSTPEYILTELASRVSKIISGTEDVMHKIGLLH